MVGSRGLAVLRASRSPMRSMDSGDSAGEKVGAWPLGMWRLEALWMAARRVISVACGLLVGSGRGQRSLSRSSEKPDQLAFL